VTGFAVDFKTQSTADVADFIGGDVTIRNDGAAAVSPAGLRLRYYFTNEITQSAPQAIHNWSQFGPTSSRASITSTVVVYTMPQAKPAADSYVEVTFPLNSPLFGPGYVLVVSWKAGAQGQGKFSQFNDYSFSAQSGDNSKMVLLDGDCVIWGTEP
jgi:hypothetical protein